MILQTNKDLLPALNKYGCYFMSILYANFFYDKDLSDTTDARSINVIFKVAQGLNYVDRDAFVNHPNGISKCFAHHHGFANYVEYQGKHDQRYEIVAPDEIILGAWYYRYTHFVVMDGMGNKSKNVIYDPLGNSETVKHGQLMSTRIYRLRSYDG